MLRKLESWVFVWCVGERIHLGDFFEHFMGMAFRDGYLYKTMSMKFICTKKIEPSFDELKKFGNGINATLLLGNRKKGVFMKGDQVIVINGDLKNLKGFIEKVGEEIIHIKPNAKGIIPFKSISIKETEICKYIEIGEYVKVVSGPSQGTSGTVVVNVKGHMVNIVCDKTKEVVCVFTDNVVADFGRYRPNWWIKI